MRVFIRFTCAAVVCAALLVTTARAVSLQDLIDSNGSLQIENKVFADFSYQTACGPDASLIDIATMTWGPFLHGICIQGPIITIGGVCDVGISYTVTATSPPLMKDIGMSFTLSATGNGGTIAIGESIWKDGFGIGKIGQSTVAIGDIEDPPSEVIQGDVLEFAPLAKVYVTKDIFLSAADPNSTVGATLIYQRFSQVPEPAQSALALLLVSAIGAIVIRHRRR